MSANEAKLSGNVETETSYPDADVAKPMLINASQSCPFAVTDSSFHQTSLHLLHKKHILRI